MPRSEHTSFPIAIGLRRLLIGIFILFLFLLLFLPRQSQEWLGHVGGPLAIILEGPLHGMAAIHNSVGETWNHYVALQQVWEENQSLKQEIQRLQGEQNQLREQAILAMEFRRLSTYQAIAPMATLSAHIIGRKVSNWYRAMVIDKGARDGVHASDGFILFLFLLLFLPRQSQEWLGHVGGPLAIILEGPLHGMAAIHNSVGETWNHYVALQQVWEENQSLKQEIQRLQGEQNQLREQAILAMEFRRLSTYQAIAPMATLSAHIIGRKVSNWYRAMVIDKGARDGVHAEMGVITDAGVVGRIVRVNPRTSVVLLLSDPNVAITGMIQTSRDEGIIQGTPQGNIHMKYLPPLSHVQVGDAVVTSGLTDDFPRGLQIGHIQDVTKSATDLFQSGEVTPIVDFSKLEGVLVITAFQPPISAESPPSATPLPVP